MMENCCEFKSATNGHVKCVHCGRGFTGNPERYNGRFICAERGPGADFEKVIARIAGLLKIDKRGLKCKRCKDLKMTMNTNGREWCRNNKRLITALAHYNAKQLGYSIPGAAIGLALRYSLMTK